MATIIAAMDKNRLIGRDNDLPWRLSADLQNFKKLTQGNTIIMGRKTWDSLGRPLPKRRNIVITRNKNFQAEGCEVVHSLEEALSLCQSEKAFIIGGGQIYSQALEKADELSLTYVDTEAEGDAWFPEVDFSHWELSSKADHKADEKNEFNFSICHYVRK